MPAEEAPWKAWGRFLKRHLTLTNAGATLFLAWMSYSFYVMYTVAVPEIPPLVYPNGKPKPLLRPLWDQHSLAVELRVGVTADARSRDDSVSLPVLQYGGERYGWELGSDNAVRLDFQFLRTTPSASAGDSSSSSSASEPQVTGLLIRCLPSPGGRKVPAACRQAAAAWRAAANLSALPAADSTSGSDRDSGSESGSTGSSVLERGFLLYAYERLRELVAAAVGHDDEDTAAAADAPAAAAARKGLVVFDSRRLPVTSPHKATAARIARTLMAGRQVYAHAAVSWEGHSPDRATAAAAGAGTGAAAAVYDPAKTTAAAAALVLPADYQPPRPATFLWSRFLPAAWVHRIAARTGQEEALRVSLAPPSVPVAPAGATTPHFVGKLDLRLVMDDRPYPAHEVPPQVAPYLKRAEGYPGTYIPQLAANPVRPLRENLVPLNASVAAPGAPPLTLLVSLAPVSVGKWQLLRLMDASLSTQRDLGASEKDGDDLIRLLGETPTWLLGMTFAVSTIHLLFDVLAMKSDVAFWRDTTSLRGISIRSLTTQLVSQGIITLFLWQEGGSLLVLIPQALTVALLVWKMLKASGIVWRWWAPIPLPLPLLSAILCIPLPTYDAALAASASEARTSTYDREATGYMYALLAPLLVGMAAHSFLYKPWPHGSAGVWEWALVTAVSAVYALGFALMVPQLWINYRLRSVAHVQWRVLGYRFFNTIIDDIFAAIIPMPMLHRISVFRDDVIFVIYLYQRWLYPVDASRPAESFEVDEGEGAALEERERQKKLQQQQQQASKAPASTAGSNSSSSNSQQHAKTQ